MSAPQLSAAARAFVAERHLAVLCTQRADGTPHAVPVGFTVDHRADGALVARVITFAGAVKARNAARPGRASVTQLDGPRWLTLEGAVRLTDDPVEVAAAVAAYAERYRPPKHRTDRVVVEIHVDRVMCNSGLR